MDFFGFGQQLNRIEGYLMTLLERVNGLIEKFVGRDAERLAKIAELEAALASALANDQADAAAIAEQTAKAEAAQTAADAATAKAGELQTLVDADTAEDEQITAALDAAEASLNPPA